MTSSEERAWLESVSPEAMMRLAPMAESRLKEWCHACAEAAGDCWPYNFERSPDSLRIAVQMWCALYEYAVKSLPMEGRADLLQCVRGNPWRHPKLPIDGKRTCDKCGGRRLLEYAELPENFRYVSLDGNLDASPAFTVKTKACDHCDGRGWHGTCSWHTPQILGLIEHAVDDMGLLPILADALEDAGCTDERILLHLRDGKRHARRCWVLRLLTEAG